MKKWMKLAVQGLLLGSILAAALSFPAGIRYVYVKSGSMEPAIPTGSLCMIHAKAERGDIRTGDIIAFSLGEANLPVAHRVMEITEQGCRTKGDANRSADPWQVEFDDIQGKVIGTVPYAGYIVSFFQSVKGVALLTGGAVLYCFGKWRKARNASSEISKACR